ncbi:MAG: PAS domain-containing sensor histidine kinase [Bacteroidetes bacterium]|nr:PAS domain-containing sensor histidine kinase [Bacteroidota bacterium]
MHILILLLPQFSKPSSGSSSAYLNQITPDSFFSLSNPVIYSILLLIVILALIFIFYKYVVMPMREHFAAEKIDIKLRQAQLMAAFAESDPDPVFRFDETGKITMTNEAGTDLIHSIVKKGRNLNLLIPDIAKFNLDECIREGEKIDFVTNLDGRSYKFTITGLPELNIGQIYGSDITDLKAAEEKLKLALKKAEDSEKIKSYFLAQMSHEIRSPLTALLGFSAIIKDGINNNNSSDLDFAFSAVEKSGNRLTRTIDQLLNMANLQTGGYEYKFEKVDLSFIIEESLEEFKTTAEDKMLKLTFECKVNDKIIFGDRYALAQIFYNLIDNAIKYTEKGEVKIILDKNKNDKLFVTVSDTGIGMSEEFAKNLFVPFTQEVMGYNRPFEGNGLGLALSKKFAELNQADIIVESSKNNGSIFTVKFN